MPCVDHLVFGIVCTLLRISRSVMHVFDFLTPLFEKTTKHRRIDHILCEDTGMVHIFQK